MSLPGGVGSAGVGVSAAGDSGTGGKPGPGVGAGPPEVVPSDACAGPSGVVAAAPGVGGKPGAVAVAGLLGAGAGVGVLVSGVGEGPPSTGFTFGAKGDFVTRNFGALPGLGGSPAFGVNFREGIGGVWDVGCCPSSAMAQRGCKLLLRRMRKCREKGPKSLACSGGEDQLVPVVPLG